MFDPLELKDIASELAGRSPAPESYLRSAINRAYFSVYLKSAWALERLGLLHPRRASSDHGDVIRYLRDHRRRQASDRLDELRILRGKADYDLNLAISLGDWQQAEYCANFVANSLKSDWENAAAS